MWRWIGRIGEAPRSISPEHSAIARENARNDILAGIMNLSSEGIVILDERMRIQVFSAGAEALFGYTAEEILGAPLDVLLPEDKLHRHRRHVAAFAAGEIPSRPMTANVDVAGRRKGGEVFPIEVGLSRIATAHGPLYTAIVRDISERRKAEKAMAEAAEKARAANEAKSAFLATMSHEIRTPLNGVLGMAQALALEPLPERQREMVQVIQSSGESLLAMLNDLLDLSRIEAGKMQLEEAVFDAAQTARTVCDTFAALAGQKGLRLEVSVAAAAEGLWRGDPLRVRQILHNLVSNALKFTERGGVQIRLSGRGGLVLEVRDSGIGLTSEACERLFEKFEQAETSTTRRFGGSGLGLSICRELAELMGGAIEVSSTPGAGSHFTVRLPLARISAPGPAPEAEAQAAPLPCLSARVLLAEDNAVNQQVICTLLQHLGVQPTVAADGQEAIEAWEREPWDLILMDVQMPRMDGPTAAGVIRQREWREGRPRTPILALTANAMSHQEAAYRDVGMDGLIAKPIQIRPLFEAIVAALAASREETAAVGPAGLEPATRPL